MRTLDNILEEQQRYRLNSAQKGAIASIAISPTEEMAYGVVTGARNAVSERDTLERAGYIDVNDEAKTARLTQKGEDVLRAENLTDDTGELTDRGKELVDRYRGDKEEWISFESFKHFV